MNGKEAAVKRKVLILIFFYFGQNNLVSLYVNRVWK